MPGTRPRSPLVAPRSTASDDLTNPLPIAATGADQFEAERPRLTGLAYRILGSRLDAEDIVQDAWLRFDRTDRATIVDPSAWLTTVVSRLALDQLRTARVRREAYVGPWLPEFVRSDRLGPVADDPETAAQLAESLTIGFLRVLETLSPVERVVFLLSDVFDVPHRQIADIVDRSPANARQIASRARKRVREERPSLAAGTAPSTDEAQTAAVVADLIAALAAGEVEQVLRLLSDEVVIISDGGASVHAARRPVVGAARAARFLTNLANRGLNVLDVELISINNRAGTILSWQGEPFLAMSAETDGQRITTLHLLRNPEKLTALALAGPLR